MKNLFYRLALIVLCVTPVTLLHGAEPYESALGYWRMVLQAHVDEEGRIDFLTLQADMADLESYISYVSTISPQTNPGLFPSAANVIAYHVNTYNALAMHGVIKKGIPSDFDSIFKRLAFFKLNKVTVGGVETSLYDYENDLIRNLGDARIHFALNCMVRDCPRLPREPFTATALDTQLDSAAREFFSRAKHLRIDHGKRTVWLSEILDFYTEDFVPSGRSVDLLTYVNRYVPAPIPADFRVRFIDYDWTINQSPR